MPELEMDIPWQWCWTIGPMLRQKLKLANPKAQPIWDFCTSVIGQWGTVKSSQLAAITKCGS